MHTSVNIIYAPFKVGLKNNGLYLEAHKPLDDIDKRDAFNMTPVVKAMLAVTDDLPKDDAWTAVENIVLSANGLVQKLNAPEADIVQNVWFLHGGTGQKVPQKMHAAIKKLQLEHLFWPLRGGSIGEIVLGPFDSRAQADEVALTFSQTAGTPVWTVQLPESML